MAKAQLWQFQPDSPAILLPAFREVLNCSKKPFHKRFFPKFKLSKLEEILNASIADTQVFAAFP